MMTKTQKQSTPVQRPRRQKKSSAPGPTMPQMVMAESTAPEVAAAVSALHELTVPELIVHGLTLQQDSFQAALSNCALAADDESAMVEQVPMFNGLRVFKPFPKLQRSLNVWISSLLRSTAREQKRSDSDTLTRACIWLRAKYTISTTKRLRVSETISLGEKRFVAIVTVEGREFLIGGGTAGMSLLAQLGAGAGPVSGAGQEFGSGGGVL